MMQVCAQRGDGRPQCWGWNMGAESSEEIEERMGDFDCSDCVDWGQVSPMPDGPFVQVEFSGTGDTVYVPTPGAALESWHGCALLAHGTVKCWGSDTGPPWSDKAHQVSDTPVGKGLRALASTDHAHWALSVSNTWTRWGERSWCRGADGVGGPVDPTFCCWDMVDPLAPAGYTFDPDNDPMAWGPGTRTDPWMSSFEMDPPGFGLAADGRLLCGSAAILRGVPQAPSWLRFLEVDIEFGG